MKITIDVPDQVVEGVREYALDIGGAQGLAFPAPLVRGLESIAQVALFRRANEIVFAQKVQVQCSWCRLFKGATGYLPRYAELTREQNAHVSHGICPDCRKKVEHANEINAAADRVYCADVSGRIEPGLTSSALPPVQVQSGALCSA
jgi:Zn finger protein HypA/HybF involved in hydrogenase expression